ncbi:Protein of unknown function [Micromonospora pattaloongensis]|uniref:DUF3147 family protein n=1 Tax=Micromonospora pattaloongensis TaxID=405436 RepID=A0A1H3QTQ2_9ACTN|nr:DUF3147 family protein [Micromonospora pattaloongensis]SDZ16972.1 Protein of unknown function [Micromonospora pattaloongensis]
MGPVVIEVAVKALAGGVFVLAFAALVRALPPTWFAGMFSAAPSVALGSLLTTVAFDGAAEAAASARGMQIGAVAFTVYCLVAAPMLRRWGAYRGSWIALVVWASVAVVGYLVVPY